MIPYVMIDFMLIYIMIPYVMIGLMLLCYDSICYDWSYTYMFWSFSAYKIKFCLYKKSFYEHQHTPLNTIPSKHREN